MLKDVELAKRYVNKANSSRQRGIAFNISFTSYKNLMRAKRCYYTGVELNDIENHPAQRTIDRINCNLPYEAGNVVACCHGFNHMKSQMERDGSIFLQNFQKAVGKMFNTVNKKSTPETAKPSVGKKMTVRKRI